MNSITYNSINYCSRFHNFSSAGSPTPTPPTDPKLIPFFTLTNRHPANINHNIINIHNIHIWNPISNMNSNNVHNSNNANNCKQTHAQWTSLLIGVVPRAPIPAAMRNPPGGRGLLMREDVPACPSLQLPSKNNNFLCNSCAKRQTSTAKYWLQFLPKYARTISGTNYAWAESTWQVY